MSDAAAQVVLLTPEGRGAIASLLVEGSAAIGLVAKLFFAANRRPLAELPINRIALGRWQSADKGEEVIVCRRDANRVEIHCHGGSAAAAAIRQSLVQHGCQAIDWRTWLRTTAATPLVAEATIALAAATTERAALILHDQCSGALDRALDELNRLLEQNAVAPALAHLDALLAFASLGCHLIEPWRVVLAGEPNVGKSSLINALLGYQRAIVHNTPGTTRDVVTAAASLDGWPVELADTAGLHATRDALEAAGIRLARERLAAADLIVLLFDAGRAWSTADQQLFDAWPGALTVHHKCDLNLSRADAASRPPGVWASALAGTGLADVQRSIVERLVPVVPAAGQAVPFLPEQVRVLSQVREALQSGSSGAARDRLVAWRGAGKAC